jgi:hypothetical protein
MSKRWVLKRKVCAKNPWILKILGPLVAKVLALTFSEGSKNLAYSFK